MPHRKVPMRSCVACGLKAPKRELVRIVRTSDGSVSVDPTGKGPGRGAYLCGSLTCWQAALKGDRLSQALRGPVSPIDKERILAFQKALPEERARKEGV